MTLHLVYEKEWVPSTRIRIHQMVPYLERRGVCCRVRAYPRDVASRRALAAELAPEDVVFLHRARPTRAEARWWRERRVPLVYDFDDAVMIGRRRGLLGLPRRVARRAGFRRALHLCDAVSCGSHALARRTEAWRIPRLVLPSPVRVDVPAPRDRAPDARLRIGWIGRSSNFRYLERAGRALRRLAAQRRFELCVISDERFELPGCATRWVPWSLASEARELAQLDVGIMPLTADPWSRGKCGYKILQYMAAGVPAVGSDVGANPELIDHGGDGFLAHRDSDWVEVLERLLDDATLRARIGAAGRRTAIARFSYEVLSQRLADFLGELADPAPTHAREPGRSNAR